MSLIQKTIDIDVAVMSKVFQHFAGKGFFESHDAALWLGIPVRLMGAMLGCVYRTGLNGFRIECVDGYKQGCTRLFRFYRVWDESVAADYIDESNLSVSAVPLRLQTEMRDRKFNQLLRMKQLGDAFLSEE